MFTRRWVVELILDLAGYVPDRDLVTSTALEPSCGSGAFLVPVVERLLRSAREHERSLEDAHDSLVAFDLLPDNVDSSRLAVQSALVSDGVESNLAEALSRRWVRCGDFLLDPPRERSVDFALGNPPYVRLESVPRERSDAYRRACGTMGGRADVYVGFFEHALRALRDGGVLGFICADRWMRNAYGARLRAMVTEGWAVEVLVSMTGVDAFEDEVDAYPAVTVLRRGGQTRGPLVIDATPGFDEPEAREVVGFARGGSTEIAAGRGYRAARLHGWFQGQASWPSGSPERLAALAHLEASFPPLEDPDTGTRVGIGIATGADKVFIVEDPDLVEPQRLLPLALPRDIVSGRVEWSGKLLANPWDAEGLVDLHHWPRLAEYLGRYRPVLAKRHTAKNGPWHKTIDRIVQGLAERPKLYLPDFKEAIFPVLDAGETYPHHNLYWVTSDRWDLRVLGGILLSDVANLFIESYSVRMRGGFLRFQAQYLRRIRVPELDAVDVDGKEALIRAFDARDRAAATETALRLYGLDELPED